MGLKMREIGFQRTYIFKIFRGSMPPDPPRKVRLRRTITFSITYQHPLENLSYAPGWFYGKVFLPIEITRHFQTKNPLN